jgi:hypothetical protein
METLTLHLNKIALSCSICLETLVELREDDRIKEYLDTMIIKLENVMMEGPNRFIIDKTCTYTQQKM